MKKITMMNKFLQTAALISIAFAAACTEKYVPVQDPEVPEGGQCLFKAEVEDFNGTYIWKESESTVGVYAASAVNTPYVLRKAFDGKSGEVEIYGKSVTGTAYACLPWTQTAVAELKEGRILLDSEQTFCTDWKSQIIENCLLAACCEEGKFTFGYPCGALKISLKMDLSSSVRQVTLTADQPLCGKLDISGQASEKLVSSSKSVTVKGIDLPCSSEHPLDIWVMLPEGSYTGLFVNVESGTDAITARMTGSYKIERCKETSSVAAEENHNYGTSDFEEEEVHLD